MTPCIVGDNHAQMDLRPAVVEDMGYEAITSSDPEEALGLVVLGVLADVNMPGMNGCEFLDRALRGDPGIHVIVMTGEYTLESALFAIRRGATDFLLKPVDRLRLKSARAVPGESPEGRTDSGNRPDEFLSLSEE